MRGLRGDISRDVIVARVTEFSEVIDMALKAEQVQLKILNEKKAAFVVRGEQWRQGDQKKNEQRSGNSKRPKMEQGATLTKPTCTKCGKSHAGECFKGTNQCFKCHKVGHYSKD